MALELTYDGEHYSLDLDDMTVGQVRAMEQRGIPNLKSLEEGLMEGDLDALAVGFWIMLVQNGQPGQRLDRVENRPDFKPMKYAKAVAMAMYVAIKKLEVELKEHAEDPKDESDPEQ